MIMTLEDYHAARRFDLADPAGRARLARDRVTMAVVLASGSLRKREARLADLIALFELADRSGQLSVYVDVFGRPMSYVLWGYCRFEEEGLEPTIWFGSSEGADGTYIVDLVITGGAVDETLDAWVSRCEHERVTVSRRGRGRRFRTYRLSRLRQFRWRVARISGRFDLPYGHGMAEHEANSDAVIARYASAISVLETFGAATGTDPRIATAVPLVFDLLALNQCRAVFAADGTCEAAIVVALSSPGSALWSARPDAALDVQVCDYVEGDGVIVTALLGKGPALAGLMESFVGDLREQRERQFHVAAAFDRAWHEGNARFAEEIGRDGSSSDAHGPSSYALVSR